MKRHLIIIAVLTVLVPGAPGRPAAYRDWVTVAEANKGGSFKDVFSKGESRHGNG